jgi:hypothetical protein
LGTLTQVRHKVVICGNHEARSSYSTVAAVAVQLSNATYLSDSGVVIEGEPACNHPIIIVIVIIDVVQNECDMK